MDDCFSAADGSGNPATPLSGHLVSLNINLATARDTQENAQLTATIQALHQTIRRFEHTIKVLSDRVKLGEAAVTDLQIEQKKITDELYIARNEIKTNRSDVSRVKEKQKQLTDKHSTMQRGLNCLEKLLGLRRFRQVVNAQRGEANSSVLDQHSKKINMIMSWFEKMSLNEFKPDDVRAFFEKGDAKGLPANDSAGHASHAEVPATVQVTGDIEMMVDDGEDEVKMYP